MAERLYPQTVGQVLDDFLGRRAGLIKALTTDFEKFYQQCDPERENLCLFGHPNGEWEVNVPDENVPPTIPEPTLGINFARDGTQKKDWLSLIAIHSDTWLLAIAFYFGGRSRFDKTDRGRIFNMINEFPTVYEVVSGTTKKQQREQSSASNSRSNSKSNSMQPISGSQGTVSMPQPKGNDGELDEEEDNENGETCGACGDNYAADEFWICCDICEKWFHGKCVKITPAIAERIELYKCPSCSNKRPRP